MSSLLVIGIFCLYIGLLFGLALWTQRRYAAGRNLVNNPLIYSLSLAIYCSSWTFYGSVGLAANRGLLFLTIYLGPTLIAVFWGGFLSKMVRLKTTHRITSLADFISTRYEKSGTLAAIVTIVAMFGTVPYVALQLKSVIDTFTVVTSGSNPMDGWVGHHVGAVVVGLMILFTIMFGVRRLEPTERHEGIVMAVAAESLVKLLALLAAGAFVVYHLYDGMDDIFRRLAESPLIDEAVRRPAANTSPLSWIGYLVLSANAIICLPRQFHITVVENQSEDHIRWAMWLFPLYLFLINLFVYPIALAGLLYGYPLGQADTFVLRLPLDHGSPWLALFVFIGGFSAATGMIMICTMTMAVMISNHLLLPLTDWIPQLKFIERRLLQCRWLVVAAFILMGYGFDRWVGHHFRLADIGLMSFAAVLQLAPALIGGLFWRGGSRRGALWGISVGFAVWTFTQLLPALVKSSLLPADILEEGLFGWNLFRPEKLFGLTDLDPVTHTVFWSLLFNVIFYVLGSLWSEPSEESQSQAEAFVGSVSGASIFYSTSRREAEIPLAGKQKIIHELFTRYFGREQATVLTEKALRESGLAGRRLASIAELAELYGQVEKSLGGFIGSASANRALARAEFFNPKEAVVLKKMYAEILAELRARPADLKRTIDFYKEREALIKEHAEELEKKVVELEAEMERRQKAEEHSRESEERYRLAIEHSSDGVAVLQQERIIWGNPRLSEIFGWTNVDEIVGRNLLDIVHPEDLERVLGIITRRLQGEDAPSRYDFKGAKKDGTPLYIAVSATTINYHGQTLYLAYLRDVTSRRLVEEEIRNLSQRLITGIEEERRRLAADLHDEFGQALTGLHLGVASLKGSILPDRADLGKNCDRLIEMIEKLAENLRNISGQLRPDMLDHLGLVSTVESFITDFKSRVPSLEVDFQAMGFKNRRLDPQVEIVVYRILQEALNNVAKHAWASRVSVQLTYSHPKVIMMVSDNGQGFTQDQELPVAGRWKKGIGLVSMKERAAAVGGAIDIRSVVGKGTMIRVTLPATQEAINGQPRVLKSSGGRS